MGVEISLYPHGPRISLFKESFYNNPEKNDSLRELTQEQKIQLL